MSKENKSLTMVREHLEDIPIFSMSPAYSLRTFQPGDEQAWFAIQSVADRYNAITPELFFREFGNDPTMLAQRQLYLCNSQQEVVGTATAWFNNNYRGKSYGRIHWVALAPDHQGIGLAKPLMSATCLRLRELGHAQAYLTTSAARTAAIYLYLRFGFETELNSADDRLMWSKFLEQNSKPNPEAS